MCVTDLEKDAVSDTCGDFRELMVALEKCRTEDGSVMDYKPNDQDVQDLYAAGVKRKGADVCEWVRIMSE